MTDLMKVLLAILWGHGLAVGQNNPDTISFLHISDVHFCNLNGYQPDFVEKRKHFGGIADSFRVWIKEAPRELDADFVVITGDMTDFYQAESINGSLQGTQIEQFLALTEESEVPLYMTLGNHDIASYWMEGKDKFSYQLDVGEARARWVRNADCFKNGTYYSRLIKADQTKYLFIFLDNGFYDLDRRKNKKEKGTAPNLIDEYQLLWLDHQLSRNDYNKAILFTHIPLFTPDTEKLKSSRNTYFLDLMDTIPETQEIILSEDGKLDLSEVLNRHPSVKAVVSGHMHASAHYEVKFPKGHSIHNILSGSFGRDTRNWRKLKLTSDKLIISFPGLDKKQYEIMMK